jgi:hypothetical protein
MKIRSLSGVVLALAFAFGAEAATISFSPSSGAQTGVFTVDVNVTDLFAGRDPATDGIISYGFNIGISDPAVLAFQGASSGSLFDAATTEPGTDVFAASSGFGIFSPVSEPLLLATLRFDALKTGFVNVTISSDLANPFQGLQYVNTPFQAAIAGQLSFSLVAVPEPCTLGIAGFALAGIIGIRRRLQ